MAHELRNPLATINLAASNIKRKTQNRLFDKHLEAIEKKVNESDQIVNNLLTFSRLKPPHFEETSIGQILEECLDFLAKNGKKKIFIKNNCKSLKNDIVLADSLQIKEVLNNLLSNAFDAVEELKGKIEVALSEQDDKLLIQVKDNGSGISKENLGRVFDPFFSTKAKGTGLGLSVCRQIIDMHGGTILIDSQTDKGTTVTLSLLTGKDNHGIKTNIGC